MIINAKSPTKPFSPNELTKLVTLLITEKPKAPAPKITSTSTIRDKAGIKMSTKPDMVDFIELTADFIIFYSS